MREDWVEIKLSEVSEQIKPGYPSGKHNTDGIGVLHFRPYNISITGNVDTSQKKYAPLKSEDYFLEKGDIVFNNTNSPELLGKTCYIANPEKWVFSNHMTRIRVKRIVNPKFCSLYLHYLYYKGFYRLHCSNHVNQASISSTFLKKYLNIPLTPLPEQRAIVAKIEQLFSELDNGIANLKAAREKLEIYRQAVLKKAFEGELTREWRTQQKDLPTADELLEQIKAERKAYYQQQLKAWQQRVIAWDAQGRKGKKPGKPKKTKELPPLTEAELADLPKLPEDMKWVKIGHISGVTGGVTKNSKRHLLKLKIPYLRVANVYANKLNLEEVLEIGINEEELERVLLKKGDLLIVEGNGSPDQIGRVAVWNGKIPNCVHQNHLIKARCFERVIPQYILYFLLSKEGRNAIKKVASSTSGLYTLSLSKIESLAVPVFSEEEQHQIVQEIETRLSVCDKLGASIDESLEKAEALRQSILKKAFGGKLLSEAELEACRKEPDWEPAAQLLERIKGKKEGVQGKLFEV